MPICECGCGLETKRPESKFRHGHWAKTKKGKERISEVHFKGTRTPHGKGYFSISPDRFSHRKLEHVVIAEKALGRSLPKKAEVHHVDGNKSNNARTNLVICPDRTYHKLLHIRQDALDKSGNADFRKCMFCQQYDAPENLYLGPKGRRSTGGTIEHRKCGNEYRKKFYAEQRNAKRECEGRYGERAFGPDRDD